ncbi:MAG: MBL fold metallo-hydrolase [Candidatus Dojkabacteria bacterium]|nr:MAG: MBL fold metallo-hydrolase [Candidatus Dojkabacteria bacterium]
MTIKSLGFTSFKISFREVDFITDPLRTEAAGLKIGSTTGDAVLITGDENLGKENILAEAGFKKISPSNRENIFEINNPGDYELGGVLVRRFEGTNTYILARKDLRLVYIGARDNSIDVDQFKKIEGDVDVLILPIGDGETLISYDKIEKIINYVDPTYLVPSAYKVDGLKAPYDSLKSVDDFVKHFGYTHVKNEKSLKVVKGGGEEKAVEVIVLG